MRLPLLVLPSLAVLALVACSDPEPAPVAPPTGPQTEAQAGPSAGPAASPGAEGTANAAPERLPGELHLSPNAPGKIAPEMPEQENAAPGLAPGEPAKAQFEAGDASVTIAVTVDGFGETAELQFIELVKGDFGMVRPRVVHIEPLKGRKSLEIAAPAALPGKFYALVVEGELPNSSFSGAEQALSLNGSDLSLNITAGQQATWMSQLPMGPPPENTLTEAVVVPENLKGGEPPPAPE